MPFPKRLQKARREERFSKFLDIFKKIEINIPFAEAINQIPNYAKFQKVILSKKRKIAEAINQIPNYAKFLKVILSKKRKITEEGIVNLTATCSAVLQ